MRRTGVAITVVLALCSLIVAHAQISGVPRSIFYDSFMQQDIEDRLGTFNLISPGERAGLDCGESHSDFSISRKNGVACVLCASSSNGLCNSMGRQLGQHGDTHRHAYCSLGRVRIDADQTDGPDASLMSTCRRSFAA